MYIEAPGVINMKFYFDIELFAELAFTDTLSPYLPGNKTMQYDADRAIAVLAKALAVCRGILYSARTGDASQGEIERLLESTGEQSLIALMGRDTYRHAMQLSEALPPEDRDTLLAIGDDPY
jgi:hypothetical protein